MAVSWEDRAIILGTRRHGEHDVIVTVLAESQGKQLGVMKGGGGRKGRGLLQPGNLVKIWWRARLDAHLGTVTCEMLHGYAAEAISHPDHLAGLSALCAMAESTLPEREPHNPVFTHMLNLLEHLGDPDWSAAYALWEMALLRDMGYGLDLSSCAATGVTDDLTHVSPKSGRAVSRDAARPYIDRLFALPDFMKAGDATGASAADVAGALRLTAHFFDTHVFKPHQRKLPAARMRFAERLQS